ncbi:hypothetical protein K438DRAFT_2022537 [Mycena galopus ATCC 62051]|nr:hypothetical protein K438DRAFT_2022537 [Mycena galopus ATCC 62051]
MSGTTRQPQQRSLSNRNKQIRLCSSPHHLPSCFPLSSMRQLTTNTSSAPRSAVDVLYGLDGVIQGPGETGIIFWRGPIDVDISVLIWYLAPMHHISCQPLLLSGMCCRHAMQDASLAKSSICLGDISHLLVTEDMPDVQRIKLNPDRRLFIRRVGVKGSDELKYLPRSSGPRTPPRPLRKADTNGKGRTVDNDDNDEVIILDSPLPALKPDRKDKGRALDNDNDDIIVLGYRPAAKEEGGATKRRRILILYSNGAFTLHAS